MVVVLEPHNPAWATEFSRVKSKLQVILQELAIISIEHVGSTSVPGLLAKPVLDIDIIVPPESLAAARGLLARAGYEDRGEMGVPGRIAFRQPVNESKEMTRNTYVVLEGCLSLRNHLDLRSSLRQDEALRVEYGEVKRRLVEDGAEDVDEYCRAKSKVILKILRSAGWNDEDLEEVGKANE